MKRAWVASVLVSLTVAPGVSAAQPILEMDPCGYASFPDKAKRDEYAALASRLSTSEPHRSVLEEWRTMGKGLRTRMSDELFELWNQTYGAVQGAVRSPMLDDVQDVLMERCLNRVRRTPQKETDVIRADIELMRSLLALSDTEFERRFRARMKTTRDLLGAPHAAGDTLRANLQIQTPNWFVHTPRALSCPSPSVEHLAVCYPSGDEQSTVSSPSEPPRPDRASPPVPATRAPR